jgi:hypothetical protein
MYDWSFKILMPNISQFNPSSTKPLDSSCWSSSSFAAIDALVRGTVDQFPAVGPKA